MSRFQLILLSSLLIFALDTKASSIVYTQKLFLGKLAPTSTSGNLYILPSGTISSSSSVQIFQTPYNGFFDYNGTGLSIGLNITFNVTTSTVVLTSSYAGAPPVTIDNLSLDPTNRFLVVILGGGTIEDVRLGGRVSFSSPPRGTYTGVIGVSATGLLNINANASGTIPVEVVFMNILSVVESRQMHFGSIDITSSGFGVVRLTPQGVRSIISGSGISLAATGTTPLAGGFIITGEPNQAVNISISPTISLANGSGGTISISNISINPAGTYMLDASGNLNLSVGGDVSILTNQQSGTYTGNYTINVNY